MSLTVSFLYKSIRCIVKNITVYRNILVNELLYVEIIRD